MMTMVLRIGRTKHPVASYAAASAMWSQIRDETGVGASKMPKVTLEDGPVKLRVSYNGRVWNGEQLVFDPINRVCTFTDPCEMCAHRMSEGLTVEKVCGGQHNGPQVALWKRIEEARWTMETREPPKDLKVGRQPDGSIIYYAFAAREDGLIGQILVTKRPNEKSTQVWTGVVYNSSAAARRAMTRLNGCEETR